MEKEFSSITELNLFISGSKFYKSNNGLPVYKIGSVYWTLKTPISIISLNRKDLHVLGIK